MAIDTPVVTGYYRFTDIWDQALPNAEDRAPLKAILAHDAIVHPDHPLHIDGVNGAQLYIGTFPTGEARLLFSSAQVDYIRYWLHAMGLTKDIIPLPYSDCLLTESSLRSVTPTVYPDGGSLRNAIKIIDKNNKRLKGVNPTLSHRRHIFQLVQTFWGEKRGMWCAMDFESWELDHTVITEFGWSLVGWKDGQKFEEQEHLIVEEAKKYINSQYVPDYRYNYNFGESKIVKSQDIKDLNSPAIQAPLEGLSHILPDTLPENGIFVVDTSDLIAALLGKGSGDRQGLRQTCNFLKVVTKFLHNAGNDAHVIYPACLKAMAEGGQIDAQRESRWPNRTAAGGIHVELKPWEEDPDYSDEEGLLPSMQGYDTMTGDVIETDNSKA
ncbi:hypothetical protein BDQ17DRAFT_1422162 [Cyathus striatus]|nr:hypothetical protein BDQ17DRAFT_1422162 [Cyathus striatus]